MAERTRIEQVVHKDYDERVYHKPPIGSNLKVGIVAALLVLAFVYLAFAKSIPFTGSGYELTAVFENSLNVRETNPVRIAGVEVGKVTSVASKGDAAEVTFTVNDRGRPINEDATITIRPRLFLEGNFFLDLTPGSPSASDLEDGDTIPVSQTAEAVQLDEVLTALQQDDRESLSQLLRGFGSALTRRPTAREDAEQDPIVRGKSAAEAINLSFRWGARAGRGTAEVNTALRGTDAGDLQRLLRGGSRTFAALNRSEQQLKDLITNFNITTGALAAESTSLRQTVRELAAVSEEAGPSLAQLNRTLPPLRAWAREIRPGVNELPALIESGTPWLDQAKLLLSKDELGGTAKILRRATPDLADLTRATIPLLREVDLLSRCTSEVIVPTGNIVIDDQFRTGVENYKEFFFGAVGQISAAQNFDGNGSLLRVQASGGDVLAASENPNGGFRDKRLFTNTIAAPIGTQPTLPDQPSPIRADVDCHKNDVPDLNGPAAAVGPASPELFTP